MDLLVFLKMTQIFTSKIIYLYLESPCIVHSGLQAQLMGLFRRHSSKSQTDNEIDIKKYITH